MMQTQKCEMESQDWFTINKDELLQKIYLRNKATTNGVQIQKKKDKRWQIQEVRTRPEEKSNSM